MAITDLANNPITPSGTTAQMLGFVVPPGVGEALTLDMYEFLIRSIRDADRDDGQLFLRRFLQGPQYLWEQTHNRIFSIRDLWSILDCSDDYLDYLKNIVGWTKELESITSELDAVTLRRLIAASVPLWKSRTTEDSVRNVLNLIFGVRSRIWNWFAVRWISGEELPGPTVLGEARQGRDPVLVSFPETDPFREFWSILRIVEPSNRELLRRVLNLMRPAGERISIVYLKFLDLFNVEDDSTQWSVLVGNDPAVEDGMIKLSGSTDEGIVANVEGSDSWSHQVISARVRGTTGPTLDFGFGVLLFVDPVTLNGYFLTLSVRDNTAMFGKIVSGIGGGLAWFDFSTVGVELHEGQWYGLRVQAVPEGATTRFKCFVDGVERINTTDSTYSEGTAGLVHNAGVTMDCDEFEVMGLPVDSETVIPG